MAIASDHSQPSSGHATPPQPCAPCITHAANARLSFVQHADVRARSSYVLREGAQRPQHIRWEVRKPGAATCPTRHDIPRDTKSQNRTSNYMSPSKARWTSSTRRHDSALLHSTNTRRKPAWDEAGRMLHQRRTDTP